MATARTYACHAEITRHESDGTGDGGSAGLSQQSVEDTHRDQNNVKDTVVKT